MSSQVAKNRLIANVGSNFVLILVSAVIGLWLTPYLIDNLTVEVYGLIPLMASIIKYFGLFTSSITASVGRFVSINYNISEVNRSNSYFNTSILMLTAIAIFIMIIAGFLSLFLNKFLKIPQGYETQAVYLFLLVTSSSLITAIGSPFEVSTFVKHRFDISNIIKIIARLLQLSLLILLFTNLNPSLMYVGSSYLVAAFFTLFCMMMITKKLTPELSITPSLFSKDAFYDMIHMGSWTLLNNVGALLYLSIDLLVINTILGPVAGGRYAPIVQWMMLMTLLADAVSKVFSPIAYEYISKQQTDLLIKQTNRSIKFIGLFMALPVGIICGLAKPFLTRWLGAEFADLQFLMWLLLAPGVINYAIRPVFAIQRGMNKVKIPAVVTIIGGFINLILSIVLVKFTSLGIYGVAAATAICLCFKNILFSPVYTAKILKQKWFTFYPSVFPGILIACVVFLLGFYLSSTFNLVSIPRLLLNGCIISVVYIIISYILLLSTQDRLFIKSLLGNLINKSA